MRVIGLILGLALCAVTIHAESPELPEGLQESPDGPELPAGLESESDMPGLLPGAPASGLDDDPAEGDAPTAPASSVKKAPSPFADWHGFLEMRGGTRLRDDPAQSKDAVLGEMRLQLETSRRVGGVKLDFTGDFVGDAVLEEAEFDLRNLRASFSPTDRIDVRAGHQILTWGTGDLLFINDLFPKDWVSFLAGRNVEYLKAPATSIQAGFYGSPVNIEAVYTPRFEPDRYVTGERLSYWNPLQGRRAGVADPVGVVDRDEWFDDDEIALRAYRNLGNWEAALYGYHGFWKTPAGMTPTGLGTFPRLNVYGASMRGPLWNGIFNIEGGYYDSRDDRAGVDPLVGNSEVRLMAGYERELMPELTGAVQYYIERIRDYDGYRRSLAVGIFARDEDRHLVTVRLTRLLMNQTLTLSLFTYYSPSDGDGHARPHAAYKWSDDLTLEASANIFFGESDHTFFGQFKRNSNLHAAARYSF